MHTSIHSGGTGYIRHSPRNGFNAYFVLSPVTGLFCHRRSQDNPATLTPASGRQDHTTSPSASSAFVSHAISVHRIPLPTSVTIAIRPSCGGGTAGRKHNFCFSESEIFRRGELTTQIGLNPLGKLDFRRSEFQACEPLAGSISGKIMICLIARRANQRGRARNKFHEFGSPAIGVAKMIGLRRTANVSATAVGSPGQARRVLTARPVPLGSMHQHPDHDSDHAQRSHDGEGDKATLERIHLRRPVPGRTAPARGLRALRPLSSDMPGAARHHSGTRQTRNRSWTDEPWHVFCADFSGAGI